MQKLVFTNGGGQTIDLTSGNFGITNWEGLSGVGLNIQTQQVPFQDGGVFLDALMEQREISITVAIQDNNDLEARYERKRQLISALNPKLGEGILVYTNDYLSRQIKAVPQLPIFENKNSHDAGTLKASVVFSCPSPYWEDLEETVISMNPDDYTSVENNGDIPTQIEIEIKGNVKDPIVQNYTSGKKIIYKGSASESLKISTLVGNKYVRKGSLGFSWNSGGAIMGMATNGLITVYVGDNIIVEDWEGEKTPIENPLQERINSIAFGNGVFVAVSDNEIIRSEDGYNWEIVSSGGIFVVYGNGLFITYNKYSIDGNTWTSGSTHSTQPVFGNGIWVSKIGNYVCSSIDGITWTNRYNINRAGKLCYGSNFIGVFENTTLTSDDGIVWVSHSNTYPQRVYPVSSSKIEWFNNKYYSFARHSDNNSSGLLYSSDGIAWTYIVLFNYTKGTSNIQVLKNKLYIFNTMGDCCFTENGQEITITVYGTMTKAVKIKKIGNTYYLLGSSIYKSTDLKNWISAFVTPINEVGSSPILDMFFVGERCCFFTVQDELYTGELYYTDDWNTVSYADRCVYAFYSNEDNKYYQIKNTGTVYKTSDITDSTSWELVHQDDIYIKRICYAEDLYVALSNNAIYTTTDFISWTQRASWSNKEYNSIEYINHRFFVVGNGGEILVSTSGISWSAISGIPSDINLYSVSFGNGTYLFGGNNFNIVTTFDLVNFTKKDITSFPTVAFIYFEEGSFYITGDDGSIYESNYSSDENAIQNLSEDSDMTLNLLTGANIIAFVNQTPDASAYISFRQKYIGV